ncbi:ADP-ribose pyrophosphatase YjhB (NUDIX family) [Stackebrandtia endophytica]|uniref:ADP-ribose pyrophosphatase YjhB (NUDIX family) n=1 Tax=Stackebrandtia endophytica TaxID=1496996 RepID=A0A543AYA3_9ACTN|nr:NUDIX hydrolase [Stackebrandtia endophytica]TQL77562.1 ADP-ribose pyrophosphatase YjhB (NUDIX family) [Stackebrandtia endophytica]
MTNSRPTPNEAVTKQRLGASGIAVNGDRVLLTRIGNGLPEEIGWWVLPGGGVDHGEHPQAAAVREVFEETGLQSTIDRLVSVVSDRRMIGDHDLHFVYAVYTVTVIGGRLRDEATGDTVDPSWVPVNELSRLQVLPLTRRILLDHFGPDSISIGS